MKAIELFKKEKINPKFSKSTIDNLKANILMNLGIILQEQKQFELALKYYQKSEILFKSLENKHRQSFLYNNMGRVFLLQNQYDSSIRFFKKALSLKREFGNLKDELSTLNNLSEAYRKKGNTNKSLFYANQAQKIMLNERDIDLNDKKNTLLNLSQAEEFSGNTSKAFLFYKQYDQVSDSLINLEKIKVIAELEAKFEVKQKEEEKLLLKLDIEKKNKENQLIIFITSVITLVTLFLGYFLYKRKKQLKIEQYKYNQEVGRLKKLKGFQQKTIIEQSQQIDDLQQTIQEKEVFSNLKFKEKEDKFHQFLKKKYHLTDKLLQYWKDQSNGITENEMMKRDNRSAGGIEGRRKRLYEKIKDIEDIDYKIWLSREESTRIYRENWQFFNS